ncbi:MAG: right-handed parallel beta-helix repeat-containing protein [candidate division WOR-3 bacterium]|nr:MAG: right-handed parallel beta-helix repeat-containing protein [candidate division WOR-3 bacterium]
MRKSAFSMSILFVLTLPGTTNATIWYVHPDSTLNSIQAALDSCSTHDTVLVGPGTYYENIIWPNVHGIDLISEYGPDSAIIDGDSAGTVIVVSNGTDTSTTIAHFTIRNGNADTGGGILCAEQSSPKILGNLIMNNTSSSIVYEGGAGIACVDSSSPFITGNTIQENLAYIKGGGIMCQNYSSPLIIGNTITTNSAWYGAGIHCDDYSSPIITGNTICHNHYLSSDDALIFQELSQMYSTSQKPDRTPFQGGGICVWYGCAPLIDNNSIFDNSIMCMGGGIACFFSSPTISNNTITGNTANDYGGGIACGPDTDMVITGNLIDANHSRHGGGIAVIDIMGQLVISNNTISANDSDGVFCDYADPLINNNNITDNIRYGVHNIWGSAIVNAESNWWGDSTGPYHPTLNPGGMGDSVSDYVDFDPWLYYPWGVAEQPVVQPVKDKYFPGPTIFRGPLRLPQGRDCRVFDITGRVVVPTKITRGIYFIEIDGVVMQKVIKIQ